MGYEVHGYVGEAICMQLLPLASDYAVVVLCLLNYGKD